MLSFAKIKLSRKFPNLKYCFVSMDSTAEIQSVKQDDCVVVVLYCKTINFIEYRTN